MCGLCDMMSECVVYVVFFMSFGVVSIMFLMVL